MEIITGQTGINREQPTVVTLGKFDGIHRGHQKLIAALFSSERLTKTVFTFTRPPREVVEQTEKKVLLTSEEKRVRMEALGVELLIEFPFTEAVCRMEPEAFVEQILIDGLHAKKIITGPDFGFGYQRRGNTALLKALAPKYGYELEVLKKELSADGNAISSTRVREEIAAGRVPQAVDLLGYPYPVTGMIGNEERTEIDAEQWDSLIADPYGWPEVAGEKKREYRQRCRENRSGIDDFGSARKAFAAARAIPGDAPHRKRRGTCHSGNRRTNKALFR